MLILYKPYSSNNVRVTVHFKNIINTTYKSIYVYYNVKTVNSKYCLFVNKTD